MEKLIIIAIYYCIINAVGALINIADKRLAIKGKRRISEKLLWVIGIYGGAAGSYAAMKAVRHKTKHKFYGRYALFNYSACCGDCNNHLSNMY